MTSLANSILATLAYHQLFQAPLHFSELYRGLISRKKYSTKAVREELGSLVGSGRVGQKNGFYYLAGQEELVAKREKRLKITQKKEEGVTRLLAGARWLPAIWGLYLTGSVGQKNATPKADVDLLVITAPGQVWLGRLQFLAWLVFWGRRRRAGSTKFKDLVCPNLFLGADQLEIELRRRNLFTAKEIAGARPVWTRPWLGEQPLLRTNSWGAVFLPHAFEDGKRLRLKRSWSWPVLARLAYWGQLIYMSRRRTCEEVDFSRAFFHPKDISDQVKKRFLTELTRLGLPEVDWRVVN